MKSLAELVKELTAEDLIEMLKILNAELAAAEKIHLETDQTRARRTIKNEIMKVSIAVKCISK